MSVKEVDFLGECGFRADFLRAKNQKKVQAAIGMPPDAPAFTFGATPPPPVFPVPRNKEEADARSVSVGQVGVLGSANVDVNIHDVVPVSYTPPNTCEIFSADFLNSKIEARLKEEQAAAAPSRARAPDGWILGNHPSDVRRRGFARDPRRHTYRVKARKPQGRNESPPRGEARSTKPTGERDVLEDVVSLDGLELDELRKELAELKAVREHIPALDELELDEVRKELAELKAKDIQPQLDEVRKELAESQQRELDELRKELAELRQPRCRRFRFFK